LRGAKASGKLNLPEGSKGILSLEEDLLSTSSFEHMASTNKVMVKLLEDIKHNTQQTADNTKQLVAEEQGAKYLRDILSNLFPEKDFLIFRHRLLLSNA
jgi:hypothetical protein